MGAEFMRQKATSSSNPRTKNPIFLGQYGEAEAKSTTKPEMSAEEGVCQDSMYVHPFLFFRAL